MKSNICNIISLLYYIVYLMTFLLFEVLAKEEPLLASALLRESSYLR